jgi:hypothetical protein
MSTLFGFINLCCPRTLPISYLPFKKLKRIVPEPLSVYLHGTIEMSLFWVTHSPRVTLYARYPRRLVRFGSVQNQSVHIGRFRTQDTQRLCANKVRGVGMARKKMDMTRCNARGEIAL